MVRSSCLRHFRESNPAAHSECEAGGKGKIGRAIFLREAGHQWHQAGISATHFLIIYSSGKQGKCLTGNNGKKDTIYPLLSCRRPAGCRARPRRHTNLVGDMRVHAG